MNYDESLRFIHALGKFGVNLGLGRIERLLEMLGNPHEGLRAVHIAGTNGKGSTAAMIDSILRATGYRVGLYTSPHLVSYTERIRVDGEAIPESDVARIVTRMRPLIEDIASDPEFGHPTEFEVGTALAFVFFEERKVDMAVIEVGLGGRFDATNVIAPLVSVITHIDYDHTDRLGTTLRDIASEKAGIIKEGVPVVVAPQHPEAYEVIEAACKMKGSVTRFVGRDVVFSSGTPGDPRGESHAGRFPVSELSALDGQFCNIKGGIYTLPDLFIPLLGRHQVVNCATALGVIEALVDRGISVSEKAIRLGVAATRWPGRMEVVQRSPIVILDGAHNLDGITGLVESLREFRAKGLAPGRIRVVIGISRDKPVSEMVGKLATVADEFIPTRAMSSRLGGAEPEVIAQAARLLGRPAGVEVDSIKAVRRALAVSGPGDLIVVCGSLYLVGDVRPLWPGDVPLEKTYPASGF
ncbi:MAG: bifunctional folylpolyglutamate synthase/dihydrofolate synthase [Firmicutes bacterium]|nr:bifunctional folylpolyglutamate synthase/dihydrofolate synthase [Bacillota bacterium]